MELIKKREQSLFLMFLRQVLWISAAIFMEVVVLGGGFLLLLNRGVLLPANYSEYYLESHKEEIATSSTFPAELIPHTCRYGLFDEEGSYLEGNLSKNQIEDIKDAILNQATLNYCFVSVRRQQELCVILYDVSAHFASPTLHRMIPNPELMAILLFVAVFILNIIGNAFYFGKKLQKELQPLIEEVDEIKRRELFLKPRKSGVKEFASLLDALTQMKTALSESLEKEWKTEQRRKDNISSLAHDIKTPLTIIKGNAELIQEEDTLRDIYGYAEEINASSDRIERYIRLLIDETKNMENREDKILSSEKLAHELISQADALCRANQTILLTNKAVLNGEVKGDSERMIRAVINIIMNAIEYTREPKQVKLSCKEVKEHLIFEVEDYGSGFTPEALRHASEQFYTQKKERQGEHYGLGMYFASCVADEHQGSLSYSNKEDHGGAIVTWSIPLYRME
ncbi:MAG: HAMP domain-containing histidine kinase [Lachnospiraceae bacterium]|nr:HAMP domain-containing histidine kinase [Lachnospiraceae bacterium]